jgi:peptidoglycan/LPS O-acetylase OafA/YrhL
LGWLRLFLALIVVVFHTGGWSGYSSIGGSLAVQAFYIISGFYMGLVLNERYDRPNLNGTFWLNRGLRIYGLYFAFLLLYLALFALGSAFGGGSPLDRYAASTLAWGDRALLALLNVTVIGLELPYYLVEHGGYLAWTLPSAGFGDNPVYSFAVIPVAWTLSLELVFYALAPFLVRRPTVQIAAICGLSFAARTALYLGWGLNSDPLNYRFFPFELGLFLAGALAYRAWSRFRELFARPEFKALAMMVPALALAYPALANRQMAEQFFDPARMAFLLLVVLALPALHEWSRSSVRDRAVGELSYPVYLAHPLILTLVPGAQGDPVRIGAVVLVTLIVCAVMLRIVDRPIESLRRRIAAGALSGTDRPGSPAIAQPA